MKKKMIEKEVQAVSYIRKRATKFKIRIPKRTIYFHISNCGQAIQVQGIKINAGCSFEMHEQFGLIIMLLLITANKGGCAFILTTQKLKK